MLTGGRGKAGGIKLSSTAGRRGGGARERILGLDIKGHVMRRLWIERAISIAREYYFSITFDRGAKAPLFMLSTMGGMDIEAVAVDHPDALARIHLDPAIGFQPFFARRLLYAAGVPAEEHKRVAAIIEQAYRAFAELDAMLVEVNPLVVTGRRAGRRAPTPSSRSTTTRCTGTPTSPRCATCRRPTRRSRWRASAA